MVLAYTAIVPASGAEQRKQPRRRLPFLRSAVAQLDDRGHFVAVVDLSRGGALLESRSPFEPTPSFLLRFVLPGAFQETRLECHLIRSFQTDEGVMALAVRFQDVEDGIARVIDEFVDGLTEPEEPAY